MAADVIWYCGVQVLLFLLVPCPNFMCDTCAPIVAACRILMTRRFCSDVLRSR